MIRDFARYHAVFAVIAAVSAVAFISMSVVWWKKCATTGSSDRRARRVFGSFDALSVLLSLAAIASVVANTSAAADSPRVLLGFFEGGW